MRIYSHYGYIILYKCFRVVLRNREKKGKKKKTIYYIVLIKLMFERLIK